MKISIIKQNILMALLMNDFMAKDSRDMAHFLHLIILMTLRDSMTIKFYENQELYFKNCEALKPVISDAYYQHLLHRNKIPIQLIGDKDSDLNYYIDGNLAFQPNAVEYTKNHVEAYLSKVELENRIFSAPNEQKMQGTSIQIVNGLIRQAVYTKTTMRHFPEITAESPFLLICGIGTGLHIPMLLDKLNVRNLLITDAYIDLLQISMEVIDWAEIIDKIHAKSGSVRILLSDDTQGVVEELIETIKNMVHGCCDGGYFYRLYNFANNAKVADAFLDQGTSIQYLLGWAEDEAQHLTNGIDNNILYRAQIDAKKHFLMPRQYSELKLQKPALIVGSGPSLAKNMYLVKNYREQFIIFSAGTSTHILLANGITPDFHIVQENTHSEILVNTDLAKNYDISAITLIHSSTAPANVIKLFNKSIMLFRDGKAAAPFLSKRWISFLNSGRTSTLMAVFAANWLGFQNINLLGIDLATDNNNITHSANTIYDAQKEGEKIPEKKSFNAPAQGYNIKIPGNFRAFVYSSNVWLFMLGGFDIVTGYFPNSQFYNASDGARIKRAIPRKINQAYLDFKPNTRAEVLSEVEAKLEANYDNILVHNHEFCDFILALINEYDKIKNIINQTNITENQSFGLDLMVALQEYTLPTIKSNFTKNNTTNNLTDMIKDVYAGTLMNYVTCLHYITTRLTHKQTQEFTPEFKEYMFLGLDIIIGYYLGSCYDKLIQDYDEINDFANQNPRVQWVRQMVRNYYHIIYEKPIDITKNFQDKFADILGTSFIYRTLLDPKYMLRSNNQLAKQWFDDALKNIKPWQKQIAELSGESRDSCPICHASQIEKIPHYYAIDHINNLIPCFMIKCLNCNHLFNPFKYSDEYKYQFLSFDLIANTELLSFDNYFLDRPYFKTEFYQEFFAKNGYLDFWQYCENPAIISPEVPSETEFLYHLNPALHYYFTHNILLESSQNKMKNAPEKSERLHYWAYNDFNQNQFMHQAIFVYFLPTMVESPQLFMQKLYNMMQDDGILFVIIPLWAPHENPNFETHKIHGYILPRFYSQFFSQESWVYFCKSCNFSIEYQDIIMNDACPILQMVLRKN